MVNVMNLIRFVGRKNQVEAQESSSSSKNDINR